MSDGLLSRCRIRVKAIVDNYVTEAFAKQMTAETKADLQQAKNIYDQLTDEVWDKFIRSIKWQFDDIDQKDAIPLLLSEIEALISQLPLPIKSDRVSTYISILHYKIAQRTAQADEEKRMLTNELLDILLLNDGTGLDWQILMALMNYVLNAKANAYMESVTITNEGQRRKAFEKEFFRLQKLPENECYMEIPVSWFKMKDFEFHIEKIPVDTLHSFGLENNMKPNFSAVHSLLNKRFLFNVDDQQDNNPLKEI